MKSKRTMPLLSAGVGVISLLVIAFVLSPTPSAGKEDQKPIPPLTQDQGILLTYLTANDKLMNVCFDDAQRRFYACVHSGFAHINMSGELAVLPLKTGDYYLYKVTRSILYVDYKKHKDFDIKPGRVTYIGDIALTFTQRHLDHYIGVKVTDNREATTSMFAQLYPDLAKQYPIDVQIIGKTP